MPTYVRVTGDDHARLGAQAERLVWFDGNRAYMRMRGGHCAALRVDLGVDAGAGGFTCTAYDVRPATCRDLGRGSPECLGERATKAGRPREAIAHLLSKPRETVANPEAAAKPETER
jgi:hypothetical protein